MTAPRDAGGDVALVLDASVFAVVVATAGVDAGGTARKAVHARRRSARWPRSAEPRWVTSFRFAPVGIAAIGVPLASMAMGGFGRGRARPVGFGPVFRPPQPHESTMSRRPRGREKSIFPAARGFASSTACSRSHTPVCCQSRNLRQQPAPVPHPISHGESRQRMPVKAARPATGLRPGYLKRRGFGGGSRGSIRAHSPSSMIGLPVASAHLPRRPDRTKPMSRPCRIGSDEVDIC